MESGLFGRRESEEEEDGGAEYLPDGSATATYCYIQVVLPSSSTGPAARNATHDTLHGR